MNPLLRELNQKYLPLHQNKEDAFWSNKMGLSDYQSGSFEKAEIALRSFMNERSYLSRLRTELQSAAVTVDDRVGLEGWQKFFEVNVIENAEAIRLSEKIVDLEAKLEASRRSMVLGFLDPKTGKKVAADSMTLALQMRTHSDESIRRAAHAGLKEIEHHVLANGFLEIVRERNRLGRMLGYEDYYDYKVSKNEGMSKKQLFLLLDELERNTREACKAAIESLKSEKGASAGEAWNFGFFSAGSVTRQLDPYFGFQSSLGRWARSFMNLGIRYRGGYLVLDLLSRPKKYENGFMHGPVPCFVEDGKFRPARVQFTSLGTPGQVGSGYSMLNTLFHEGGHAAHFCNITMPAPCFSQEFAPTSVAFAETQSMFCDSLVGDVDWRVRYAKDAAGNSVPHEVLRAGIESGHRFFSSRIRQMLTVCYVEKAIYEMAEAELEPANVLKRIREIEASLLFLGESPRPTLSVPHLLSGESSAYYHGYVLAEMAVHQTRRFFVRRDGYLLDNSKIGPDLARHYWQPGNSKTFLELVHGLTQQPFSAEAIVELINRPLEDEWARAQALIRREKDVPFAQDPIDLDAVIRVVDGDHLIATNENGEKFEELENQWKLKLGGNLK